jgi:hypothetical protein
MMALRPLLLVAGATLFAVRTHVAAVAAVLERLQRMLDLTNPAHVIASPQPFHQRHYTPARIPGDLSLLARVNHFLHVLRADQRLLQFARTVRLDTIPLAGGEWCWPDLPGH